MRRPARVTHTTLTGPEPSTPVSSESAKSKTRQNCNVMPARLPPFLTSTDPALEAVGRAALELTPVEHLSLLHPKGRKGSVTIARKTGTKWQQHAVRIEDLPKAAASLAGMPDIYVSPNSFWGERHTKRLAQIGAAYSDLDYYNAPQWRGCTPETVMYAALDTLEQEGVPLPSWVLFSGRGLLLLWLHSPLPPQALDRWTALQSRIFSVLKPFAPDANARDVARVFRVAGSVNQKSGETVRLL
jgi:hypothetical protein